MDSTNDVFRHLYMELMQTSVKQCDKHDILELFKKLNSLNYNENLSFITTWTCTDLLLHVVGMIKEFGHNEVYLKQICQLIVNVAAKQKIIVCSMSVNVILHGLKDVWVQVLTYQQPASDEICAQLLGAICAVTYGNGAYIIHELLEWLIGKHGKSESIGNILLSPVSMDLKKMCLQCLSGLCMTSESREKLNEDHIHYCLQLFIQALQTIPNITDVPHYRVIFAAHKGIQYILDGSGGIHVNEIGPLLAILKKHLVFGLPTKSDDLPSILQPIPVPETIHSGPKSPAPSSSSTQSVKKKKKRNRRKQQGLNKNGSASGQSGATSIINDTALKFDSLNINNTLAVKSASSTLPSTLTNSPNPLPLKMQVTSSESEYSDTEGGQFSAMISFALKIRQMAIGSLYIIVRKTSKLIMLGYWNSFIPGASSSNDISLLSCIINDPAAKARVAALMVLYAMLDGSRHFLALAVQEKVSTSYVSFSAMLTSSVHDIHNTLLKALTKERSSLVLVHILKAISTLAANSPYTKLSKGFISSIFAKVRVIRSTSRDVDCRIGALNVFISLLSSDPALVEVANCITDCDSSSRNKVLQTSDTPTPSHPISSPKSWLIEDCIVLCQQTPDSSDIPLPLRIAALQLITTASKLYFPIVKSYLTQLTSVISCCMGAVNASVRLHASKMLEEVGGSLLRYQKSEPELVNVSLTLWQELMSGQIQTVAHYEEDFVNRSHVCDFLATIGPVVFEQLDMKLQVYCQTLLLGLTSDENYLVRSASIRALAVFIMYPVLRKDICFIEDVAACFLRLMKDPVKSVQSNAAWSFGNFTDAIIINIEAESEAFSRNKIGDALLMELIGSAIKAFDSKDKVRFNMMRVLGNMLRFFNESHVQSERFRELILQAKSIIVNAMLKDPLMKVRWNACLACGNMLRNKHLSTGKPEWTDDMYTSLCTAVSFSKNYKVRIKAAVALGCPTKRESFGSHFTSVYVCILNALRSSDTSEVDFGEYKFKDKLQEHLTYTLLTLTTFLELSDIPSIVTALSVDSMYDFIKSQINRWDNAIYNHHDAANCAANDVEGYAALGQFSNGEKKKMFEDAVAHWDHVTNSYCDSDSLKDLQKNNSAQFLKGLFTVIPHV